MTKKKTGRPLDPANDDLRRAILRRVIKFEAWMRHTRGPTMSEIAERFHGLREPHKSTVDAIRGQLDTMIGLGWLKRARRQGTPPTVFYVSTPAGREQALIDEESGLDFAREFRVKPPLYELEDDE